MSILSSSISMDPSVSINNLVTTTYPSLLYPSSTVINASVLTPNTMFPIIPTFPTVASVGGLSTYPFINPIIPSVVTYPDVNSNSELRRDITEYFFDKLINNWLKYHYIDLYHMLVVSNGQVVLIKDLNQASSNTKNDPNENASKYQFLLVNYFAKNDVYKLLDKFRKLNGVNWWDLKHLSDDIRKFIHHKVVKYIKKQIMGPTFPAK